MLITTSHLLIQITYLQLQRTFTLTMGLYYNPSSNILSGSYANFAAYYINGSQITSTAELNILDGATLSTSELNILDGVFNQN